MNQYKIPSTIMDVLREAAACESLAKQYGAGWFPSPRAIIYAEKGRKLNKFATAALTQACPDIAIGEWRVDMVAGVVQKVLPPKAKKPKAAAKQTSNNPIP